MGSFIPRNGSSHGSLQSQGCCLEECFVNVFRAIRQLHLFLAASEQPDGVWSRLRCPVLTQEPVHAQFYLPCFCSDMFVIFHTPGQGRDKDRKSKHATPTVSKIQQDLSLPVMLCYCSCGVREEKMASSLINFLQM